MPPPPAHWTHMGHCAQLRSWVCRCWQDGLGTVESGCSELQAQCRWFLVWLWFDLGFLEFILVRSCVLSVEAASQFEFWSSVPWSAWPVGPEVVRLNRQHCSLWARLGRQQSRWLGALCAWCFQLTMVVTGTQLPASWGASVLGVDSCPPPPSDDAGS